MPKTEYWAINALKGLFFPYSNKTDVTKKNINKAVLSEIKAFSRLKYSNVFQNNSFDK